MNNRQSLQSPYGKVMDFEQGWNVIKNGITKLTNKLEGLPGQEFGADEHSLLYTTVFNLCTCMKLHPNLYPQQLYDRYKETLVEYIDSKVLPALREKYGHSFLEELGYRWNIHKTMVRRLSQIFHYLDCHFVVRQYLPALSDVGLMYFRDLVYNEIKVNLKDAVISLIDREREGEQIDRALIKNVRGFLVEIWIDRIEANEDAFETLILADIGLFYRRKASSWIQEESYLSDYMTRVDECLKQEEERIGHYLHASRVEKVLEMVREELLNRDEFVEKVEKEYSGCHILLRDDKVENLSRMYSLLCTISKGLKHVAAIFRQHVIDEGTALVKQVDDGASNKKAQKDTIGVQEQIFIIQKLIELNDKHLRYVIDYFENHFLLHKALEESFRVFCNKGLAGSTSAEFLASSCNNLLKKGGSKKLSDEAIEDSLEMVVKLLAYINDKDLFAESYEKKLARRILFDNCANDDHERSILTKLKHQYGAHFTSKMEGMVSDLALAREKHLNFKEYLQENMNSNGSIDMKVFALKSTHWPNYMTSNVALPPEMVKCIEVFTKFYQAKTENRKLTWIYSLGTCNVIGKFALKPIELIITTYQAIVLLLFNDVDKLSYNEIKNKVNLGDEDIVKLLHSLSCGSYKILNKVPDTKIVEQDDTFVFNTKFTDKLRRIKVPLPQMDDDKKVKKLGDKDKHYSIDTTIVRIMKRRKQLPLQHLVVECVEHLGPIYKPSSKVIKNRVEDLIASEYLERDKSNPKLINYLA